MPACGDGVVGVLVAAGFRSRAVCGPKMRARPAGSVSGARRPRGGGKPRRGGRRSAGFGPARLFCMKCSAPRMSQFFHQKWTWCWFAVGPCRRSPTVATAFVVGILRARAKRYVTHLALWRVCSRFIPRGLMTSHFFIEPDDLFFSSTATASGRGGSARER